VNPEGAQLRPSPTLGSAGVAAAASTLHCSNSRSSPAGGSRPSRSPLPERAPPSPQLPQQVARKADAPAPVQRGSFPSLPQPLDSAVTAACTAGSFGGARLQFDPRGCSALLQVDAPSCLRCITNATRASQGVCFLDPPVEQGQLTVVRFRFDNKPGRMRYFVGVARKRFASDCCDADLRRVGWSIENLYASPHSEGQACTSKTTPIFHTGSIVTLAVDMRDQQKPEVRFAVDTTGVSFSAPLPKRGLDSVVVWISLYNRLAQVTLLDTD